MRGELSSGTHAKKHPLDWYVDEVWCAEQLAIALGDFQAEIDADLAIWDPCCGYGNTIDAAYGRGLRTFLSDVVQNVNWDNFPVGGNLHRPVFEGRDFREFDIAPAPCSIVFNPPYSYIKGILEALVRHALRLATGRVCALVPTKWQSSQTRYDLFMVDHPPLAVLHLTQRPSMPPGDMIQRMGKRAFRGGKVDYCWIVWDVRKPTAPGDTRTIWLPPLARMSESFGGLA